MDLPIEEAIKKYDIHLETSMSHPEKLADSDYILIRHGLSEFNYKALVATTDFGKDSAEMRAVETQKELTDPELHAIGIKQCEAHQPQVNAFKFHTVFSSPMQRAMMTTIHMFKNHPDKENIRFVVLPIAREVLHTTNDICMNVFELIEKYGEGKPEACGIVFDFSRLFVYGIPELWQVFTLANVDKQKLIVEKLKKINPEPNHEAPQRTNYKEVMVEILPQFEPRFEDADSLLRRAVVIREFMKEYLRVNPLPEGQRNAIVCHSQIIATMTAD